MAAHVQVVYYREVGSRGQEMLREMSAVLSTLPDPQGGVGRLHLPGVTIGESPFAIALHELLRARGYKFDSLNWIFHRKYADDFEAEQEMAELVKLKAGEERERPDSVLFRGVQFRVMQDPSFGEGWDVTETF